jgi:hypothetical protein
MMNARSDYPSVMTILSPLAHSERTVGIDAKFRRLGMQIGGRIERVPVLSGNSIRGLLRRASGRDLLARVGVERGTIAPAWIYLLASGGTLSKGETRKVFDPAYVRELRRLIPPFGLFGGSLQGSILPGSIDVDMAVPIVSETAAYTGAQDATMRLADLLEEIPYTRRDDLEDRDARKADESVVQMRYSVECLRPGSRLAHGLRFRTTDPVLRGCLWRAVAIVAESRMGGMGGRGHGRFSWTWEPEGDEIAAYVKHVEEHSARIRDLISGAA